MDAYAHVAVRLFFACGTAVGLVFMYAAAFDRDLPPKIAAWYFGTLSGGRVTVRPSAPEPQLGCAGWFGLALICAVPPAAWLWFERFVA